MTVSFLTCDSVYEFLKENVMLMIDINVRRGHMTSIRSTMLNYIVGSLAIFDKSSQTVIAAEKSYELSNS